MKFMKSCMDFITDREDKDFSSGSSNLWSDKKFQMIQKIMRKERKPSPKKKIHKQTKRKSYI